MLLGKCSLVDSVFDVFLAALRWDIYQVRVERRLCCPHVIAILVFGIVGKVPRALHLTDDHFVLDSLLPGEDAFEINLLNRGDEGHIDQLVWVAIWIDQRT